MMWDIAAMAEDWNSYICKVNDAVASIALDLGLRGEIPDGTRPELLWVWVYSNSPRDDGLTSSLEFPTLVAIENKITEFLKQNFQAVFCGRITTQGRRELYYYAANSA